MGSSVLDINKNDIEENKIKKIWISEKNDIIPLSGIRLIDKNNDKNNKNNYENVLSEINIKDILKNLNHYLDINSVFFTNFYEMIKNEYPHIKKDELFIIVKYVISSNIPFVNIDKGEIEKFIKNIQSRKSIELVKLEKIQESLEDIKKIMDFKDGLPAYKIIFANIHFNISDSPLDIYSIINKYKLSERVPFMMTLKEYSSEPLIKYYKETDIYVKDWIYKNSGKNKHIKKPKGLSVKIYFQTDNTYKNLTISRSTKNLYIKLGLSSSEKEFKYEEIQNICKDMDFFFKELKTFIPEIINPSNIKYIISNFSAGIKLKQKINLKRLNIFLRDSHFVVMMSESSIKIQDPKNDIVFSIKSDDTLTITNLKNKKDIYDSFNIINEILLNLQKNKSIKLQDEQEKKSLKIHGDKNKRLKELGIPINSTECQKLRQITIIDNQIPKDITYTINYKDKKLYCDGKDYPYPGYTNTNIPCCFKKDQRNKEAYKRNTLKDMSILQKESDNHIINSHLITTNKILDINRLGVLHSKLNYFKDEQYLRVGVLQKNSFINSIEFLIKSKLNLHLVTEEVYISSQTTNYKSISDLFTFINFKTNFDNIKNNNYYSQDVIQKILEIGIIVLNENTIEFPDKFWNISDYKEYILIYKHPIVNSYEPITRIDKKNMKICRIFLNNSDIISNIFDIFSKNKISSKFLSAKQLKDSGIKVTCQYINDFNKIEYINTPEGILPVLPSTPIYKLKQTKSLNFLHDSQKQYNFLKRMGSYFTPNFQYVKGDSCVAISTELGIHVPVSKESSIIKNLEIINFEIPQEISNLIFRNKTSTTEMDTYIKTVKYYNELYNRCVYTLSVIINKNIEIKNNILNLLKLENMENLKKYISTFFKDYIIKIKNFEPKLKQVIPSTRVFCKEIESSEFLDPFCDKNGHLEIPDEKYDNILQKLAIDLKSDNRIINGDISLKFSTQNIIKRKDEIFIESENDVKILFG